MKQFGFETNIERRSPFTGNVFMIDRMTSQWAEEHPLDVDAYIEQVWQKYQAMVQENLQQAAWAASREQLRKMWDDVLGDMNPRGNAKLYPNHDGRQQPALMEVWLKAGDYWRRGLRLGDVIPAMVPSFKITRIGSDDQLIERYSAADKAGTAWISLGDCDMHLLTDSADSARGQSPDMDDSARGQVPGMGADDIEAMGNQATPARGQSPDIEAATGPTSASAPYHSGAEPDAIALTDLPGTCPLTSNKRQRRQKAAAAEKPQPQQLSLFDEELMAEQQEESVEKKLLRSAGYLAAAAAAIVFVWETGLIIPLGLIGLGASGLLR